MLHDQATSLLTDEYNQKADAMWDDFRGIAVDGAVTFDEAYEIVERYFSGVKEDHWDNIETNDDGSVEFSAIQQVAAIIFQEQEGVQLDEKGTGLATMNAGAGDGGGLTQTVKLRPWAWIKHRLMSKFSKKHHRVGDSAGKYDVDAAGKELSDTSSTRSHSSDETPGAKQTAAQEHEEVSVVYELDMSVDLRPREIALTVVALLMLLIAAVIVMAMALLWINSTASLEQRAVERLGQFITSLSTSFEDAFMTRNGLAMREQADGIGWKLEALHSLDRDAHLADTRAFAERVKPLVASLQGEPLKRHVRGNAIKASLLRRLDSHGSVHDANAAATSIASTLGLMPSFEAPFLVNGSSLVVADVTVDVGAARVTTGCRNVRCLGDVLPAALDTLATDYPNASLAVATDRAATATVDAVARASEFALSTERGYEMDARRAHVAGRVGHTFANEPVAALQREYDNLQCATPRYAEPSGCARIADMDVGVGELRVNATVSSTSTASGVTTNQRFGTQLSLQTNESSMWVPVPEVSVFTSTTAYDARVRKNLLLLVDHLNFNFVRSTELVVGGINRTTGESVPQMTSFRFFDGCYEECSRFIPSAVNFDRALRDRGSGWQITPDYRPEPIIGAYRWFGNGLDAVFLIERDVIEVRKTGVRFLKSIADGINAGIAGSTEVEFMEFTGNPRMRYFFSENQCAEGVDCRVLLDQPNYTMFRYDCQHCQRLDRVDIGASIEFVTEPKKTKECTEQALGRGYSNCSSYLRFGPPQSAEQYRKAMERSTGNGQADDYATVPVTYSTSYILNYSMGVVVKVDRAEYIDPINAIVGIAIGVNFLFILVGIAVVLIASSSALTKVEKDWKNRQEHTQLSLTCFDRLSKSLIPTMIRLRLVTGQRMVAENMPSTAFVETNLVLFSEWVRGLNHRHVARVGAYIEFVLSTLADTTSLTRLNFIGDSFIAIANREETLAEMHPTRRATRFAVSVLELFSKNYRMYPQDSDDFQLVFSDWLGTRKHLSLPVMRIGGHYGNAIFGATEGIGNISNTVFDCYGSALALTHRMQANADPAHFNVSASFYEALLAHDRSSHYSFDPPRTGIRGTGAGVTMHQMRSSHQPAPKVVMSTCSIEPAIAWFPLDPEEQRAKGLANGQEAESGGSDSAHSTPKSSRQVSHASGSVYARSARGSMYAASEGGRHL